MGRVSAVVSKVFAYITQGDRLLIFRHTDFPEAGIQVPAGTVKPGERPEDAVLREAIEETGLTDLTLTNFLGEQVRDRADVGLNQIHHQHFYHLKCGGHPPETWQHDETDPSDGSPAPIHFEFFWAQLPWNVPELVGDDGAFLTQLCEALSLTEEKHVG
jgi:8-oxo-dGTP diphosphatase